jgi:hypothetical protein
MAQRALSLIALALALAPRLALACPSCVGQQRNPTVMHLLGLFLLVPFVLFLWVVWAIRRARCEAEARERPGTSATVGDDGATLL